MISQAIRNQIAEAQKIASGSGSEQDIAEAKIELEVCQLFFSFSLLCIANFFSTGSRNPPGPREIDVLM